MDLKTKKYEKMIRREPTAVSESHEKVTMDAIRSAELETLKQRIFVNSFSRIGDEELREKCSEIVAHYRLFRDDESHFAVVELSADEKEKLKNCIDDCVREECAGIVEEKKSIPADLLELIESSHSMPSTLKNKLSTLLSLLNKYSNNKKEIHGSILKLLDSSDVNISEAQQLEKQIDIVKANSNNLQSDIINKFSCSEEALQNYYNAKKNEYAAELEKLENLQNLQEKYEAVDGPQYRALVKRFEQAQELIKLKMDMFNSYQDN